MNEINDISIISLDFHEIVIYKDLTRKLIARVDNNLIFDNLNWNSSDFIVSIDNSGNIRCNDCGETTITATSPDNAAIYDTCRIICKENLELDINDNLYIINDYNDLLLFKEIIENGYSINAKIVNDIDMESKYWYSINNTYSGTFYGGAHNITNYRSNGGIFSCINKQAKIYSIRLYGIIKNDDEKNISIGSIANTNFGLINSCLSNIDMENISTDCTVGGICGKNEITGYISNCVNIGNIKCSNNNKLKNNNIGGICGKNNSIISNCTNIGNVYGTYISGGISGSNYNGIYFCNNLGLVDNKCDYNGSIYGFCPENTIVSNCESLIGSGKIHKDEDTKVYNSSYSNVFTILLSNKIIDNNFIFDYYPKNCKYSNNSIELYFSSLLQHNKENTFDKNINIYIDKNNGYLCLGDIYSNYNNKDGIINLLLRNLIDDYSVESTAIISM